MVRKLSALRWPLGLLLVFVTATAAVAAPTHHVQSLVFDATFTSARTAGPGPDHVGHRQIVSGVLRDSDDRRTGTLSFTCTSIKVDSAGVSERCRALAFTSDGRLDAAGPSDSSAVLHTWRLIGGTGRYRGASGTVTVRDLGDREALLSAAMTTPGSDTLRAGKISRPAANGPFIARVDGLCQRASGALATLPPFPIPAFNPLNPDPSQLRAVGAFFTGPGDPRPILRTLGVELLALGPPPRQRGVWRSATRAREDELAVMDDQDQAALAGNVLAFVRTVHASSATFRHIAITATVFGSTSCVM